MWGGGKDAALASNSEGSGGVSMMLSVNVGSVAEFDTKGDANEIYFFANDGRS